LPILGYPTNLDWSAWRAVLYPTTYQKFHWRAGFAGKVAREPKNIGLAGKVG